MSSIEDIIKAEIANLTPAQRDRQREAVRKVLAVIPKQEADVIELRFGFRGAPRSHKEIALELGVSVSRVRNLEGQALSRMAALRELTKLAT